MYITIAGYIILPLGIIFLFLPGNALLVATVALSGFTGMSVIIFNGFSLQPSYYLAFLWIIQLLIRGKFEVALPSRDILIMLSVFLFTATASLVMPLLLDGKVTIMNVEGEIESLHFSKSNVTQLAYLFFVAVFFIFLSGYMNKKREAEDTVYRAYIVGVVLFCAVTVYQIIAYKFELPFDSVFKTALIRDNLSDNLNKQIYWDKRISGPCLEASMLAYYIVPSLPLCTKIKSWKLRYFLIPCLFFIGLLSLSSTFLVGVVCWMLLEFILYLRKKPNLVFSKRKLDCLILSAILLFMFLILLNSTFDILTLFVKGINALVLKLNKGNISGQERYESFTILMEAFLGSPLFGVGFGSVRGKDLFSTWLADVGVVGMTVLVVFLFFVIRSAAERGRRQYLVATVLVWLCMFISVPEPYNLFVWIIMALSSIGRVKGSFPVGVSADAQEKVYE